MVTDIVVDNNVFLHADNPIEIRQKHCQQLLAILQKGEIYLCLDDGFDLNESKNRSHIGHEYLKHLRFGSLGFAVIQQLAKTARIRIVPRSVPGNVGRQINSQVSQGPDRTYLKVTYNSISKTLASHDLRDISNGVRARLKENLGITVLVAEEAILMLG